MQRLAILVVAALGGFAIALIRFGHAETAQSCLIEPAPDTAYAAAFEGSVSMDQTNHVLDLKRDGQPVSGVSVCLNTYMVGMSGMAMTADTTEMAPGRFAVPFQFAMGGPWRATVVVTPRNGLQVSVPITFMVNVGAMPSMSPGG